jgi:hypothetical protein
MSDDMLGLFMPALETERLIVRPFVMDDLDNK